jgi:pSer/pThr/pTyr-binding forkhead associated (FHA) protein
MDKDVMPFGRTSAWMPVVDAGVSRHHGEFVRQPDGSYCVRDVGSANGTFLNGKQLQGQELRAIGSLDEIAFGFWHLIKIEP